MTAKILRIRNRYDKLENRERLRLITSAIERGDDEEIKAIISTTQKKTYRMPDAWVVDRYDAIWKVSVMFWLFSEEVLRERDNLLYQVTIYEQAVLFADKTRHEKWIKAAELVNIMISECENQLWAISEAVRQLVAAADLQAEALLVYTPETVKERLNQQRHACDNLDDENALQQMVRKYFEIFATHWPDVNISDRFA